MGRGVVKPGRGDQAVDPMSMSKTETQQRTTEAQKFRSSGDLKAVRDQVLCHSLTGVAHCVLEGKHAEDIPHFPHGLMPLKKEPISGQIWNCHFLLQLVRASSASQAWHDKGGAWSSGHWRDPLGNSNVDEAMLRIAGKVTHSPAIRLPKRTRQLLSGNWHCGNHQTSENKTNTMEWENM